MKFFLRWFIGVSAVIVVTAQLEDLYYEYPKIKQDPSTYEIFTAIKIILNAREKILTPKDFKAEVSLLKEIKFLFAAYVRKYLNDREENFVKVVAFVKSSSLNENEKRFVSNIFQRVDFALLNFTYYEVFRHLEEAVKKIVESMKRGKINWY